MIDHANTATAFGKEQRIPLAVGAVTILRPSFIDEIKMKLLLHKSILRKGSIWQGNNHLQDEGLALVPV
jgi:hypothetical protein